MIDAGKKDGATIQITKNGLYIVIGRIPLMKQIIVCNLQGESIKWQEGINIHFRTRIPSAAVVDHIINHTVMERM